MRSVTRCLVVVAIAQLAARPALANPESDALRARGAIEIYNMDRDQALETYRRAVAADPGDAAAYRGLASAIWLGVAFRRGNMTVDDYLGRANRTRTTPVPPPGEAADAFRDAIEKALALARTRLEANPRDIDAHYQAGAAAGLRASYIATIDGRATGALRAARDAYN